MAEDEFVRLLRRGDAEAYVILVRLFEGPLYRYFFASHGDAQLACEQSADCFGDLVECLPKMFGGGEQLRSFVFGVARNVLRQQWRLRARKYDQISAAAAITDGMPPPDMALELSENGARVIDAIRSLDDATRDVFLLRFVEQMSVADVAEVVGEPIGTVKSRLHRGRQQLHGLLKAAGGLP